MRYQTIGTIFNTVFGIFKTAAALIARKIQRAIAEQTVKILGVVAFVTGEIFTFLVGEKSVVFIFPV